MTRESRLLSRALPFLIAAVIFVFDRWTKGLIKAHFGAWDSLVIIPGFFNIVHSENPGVAFGILSDATGIWRTIFLIGLSAAVLVFIIAMLLKPSSNVLVRTGLALIMGGAFGNLFDRVVNGTVTDFVELYAGRHYFPAFNVADSAITIGAGLLLLDMLRQRPEAVVTKAPEEHTNAS
jgi:signal peptidase II